MKSTLVEFPGLRVSTLTPASISLVKKVGAWEYVQPPYSASFTGMEVSHLIRLFFCYLWLMNKPAGVVTTIQLGQSIISSVDQILFILHLSVLS